MTVEDGYVLQDSDYPELPEVVGAAGIWVKRTSPIHSDITLNAKYVAKIPHYVTFTADGKTVKVLEVSDGYVLKDSDYPTVPAKNGYTGHWNKYTSAIRSDITIKATYKKDTGLPIQPTRPSGAVMSEELPEPIEPQDVEQPENDTDTASADNTVEPLADHSGQGVVSSQTVTHEYLTRAGKVARETVTRDGSTEILDFIYDESGKPFALNYSSNGGNTFTTYYYILNLQGDVVKLAHHIPGFEYEEVASYEYDAWGNILSKSGTMADKNPLRYRGYYYDTETGYYYLQSRYYDPANRRFINADSYSSTGQGFVGTNMFAYCNNNPVMKIDPNGEIGIIGVIIGVVAICIGLSGCATEEEKNWPEDCPYQYVPSGQNRTAPNCYTYAFDYGSVGNPGDFSGISPYDDEGKYSLSMIRTAVLADAEARGKRIIECTADPRDYPQPSDAVLVACKVSDDRQDYHFAARLPNGIWVDKPGSKQSRYGKIDGFADEWVYDNYTYNSGTLYFYYYR